MTQTTTDVDTLAINTIRFLAVDMVERAKSGHPGAPMGQAALGYLLFTRHLRHDPTDPGWPDRDRFVLSCGHASALLYTLLHLSGYDLPMEELQRFRQLGSRTAGHPESHLTPGVETTTGPLGQGLGNAVGMAIAQRMAAATFNVDDYPVVDHRIWALASDGDLMEGVASEACSLAGHHRLGRLNVFYDDNRISIDGPTSLTFTEDVGRRFEAYGWQVLRVADGNDLAALDEATRMAAAEEGRPTLVVVRTHIGYGSPGKQDTAAAHGAPLGPEEVAATRRALGWPEEAFHVPEETREVFAAARQRGRRTHTEWRELFERYAAEHPGPAADFRARLEGRLPDGWEAGLPRFSPDDGPLATRKASGAVIAGIAPRLPWLAGGSADLAGSNNTYQKGAGDFSPGNPGAPNIHFGVREHAMGAVLNGMALTRMQIPYGGTFLIFSDYMRPSVRLAALMGLPVLYIFTHDSIFLGEDGPTHQPVSQLMGLRAIPNLTVIRPGDANETVEGWRLALANRTGPTALVLTRQKLPILAETAARAATGVPRGGYVLADAEGGEPEALLIATGSEVPLALAAREKLAGEGVPVRVVSLPCWEVFGAQNREYRDSVLPPGVRKRLAVEAGSPLGWERWVGDAGDVLGVERFGASAPYQDLATEYGFTVDNVVRRLRALLG
ncbi:MAG: transketolase [Thermoanaerobaculia bacterium]|nr:transketolase [Thermoanaerobaculia bacterium]